MPTKSRGHTTPKNMGAASLVHFDALWWWNTLERRPRYCTLDFHIKVQVWRKSLSVLLQIPANQRSILVSRRCQPCLAWKREREREGRNRKEKKKNKGREKKREKGRRKEWESHGSTHSSSSPTQIIRLLIFLSKPLLFHSDRSGLQGVLFPRTR